MTVKVAFLGLGIMGGAMSANLARGRYSVSGWNRTSGKPAGAVASEAGVKIEQTAEEAVDNADFVFLCLGDERDLEAMLLGENGLASRLKRNALVIDMSTTGPKAAQHAASGLLEHGVRFLDAPVSGGDIGAKNGTLTIMVGGAEKDFEECRPLFECMGKNIRYCGPTGSGQGVKLCNQILCAVNMVAVCEAFRLAEDMDIDPQMVVDVCSTGAAGSWALANLGPKIVRGDFAPAFMMKHMLKDLRLVAETIGDMQHELPGTELAERQFEAAVALAEGNGEEQGTQAMMRAYRRHSRVESDR